MSSSAPKNYFENLDATRFLGFFHVFLAHCFFTTNPQIENSKAFHIATVNIRSGFLGLDYFFVLSSFLLTWLALNEWQKTGNFKPGLFMIRRGLRLWPLYFLLVLGTYITVFFWGDRFSISELPPISVFLLFVSNLWVSIHGQGFLFLLVFFWSIAVEEQFYVFWAFVLRFLHNHLVVVSFVMIAISLIFRALNLQNEPNLFFNTLSYLGNFGIGALTANLAFQQGALLRRIEQMPRWFILSTYLLLLTLTLGYFRWFQSPFMIVTEKIIFGIFFSFLILEQCYAKNSLFKLGKFKVISYFGQLSLGLYCFHGIVLTLAIPFIKSHGFAVEGWQVYVINPFIIFSCTLIIAWLSYRYFEQPIHNKRRFFYPKTSSKTSGV